jgi:hypothetical protein
MLTIVQLVKQNISIMVLVQLQHVLLVETAVLNVQAKKVVQLVNLENIMSLQDLNKVNVSIVKLLTVINVVTTQMCVQFVNLVTLQIPILLNASLVNHRV